MIKNSIPKIRIFILKLFISYLYKSQNHRFMRYRVKKYFYRRIYGGEQEVSVYGYHI